MIKKLLTLSLLFVTSQSFSMHYTEENLLRKSLQVLKTRDSRKAEVRAVLKGQKPFTDLSPELLIFLMHTISPTLPLDAAVENFLAKKIKKLIKKRSTHADEYDRTIKKIAKLTFIRLEYDLYVSSSGEQYDISKPIYPTEEAVTESKILEAYNDGIQIECQRINSNIFKIQQILINIRSLSDLNPEDLN